MSDDKYEYGRELKSIRFMVSDDDHARLLIRLRHNKVNVAQFFRAVIDGMIQEEENLMQFFDNYVLKHKILSRHRFTKSLKLKKKGKRYILNYKKKGQEVLEDWGLLDDAEKQEIFDLISKEFPDL